MTMSLLSGYVLVYDLYICSSVVIMMYISQKQLNDISEEKKQVLLLENILLLNWTGVWILEVCE